VPERRSDDVAPSGFARDQRDWPRPTQDRTDATGDIEIHIGRIEVTAAPPAPLRAPPTARQRKAMPLAEYLRRRDGRRL
jgi:hypothetical protein